MAKNRKQVGAGRKSKYYEWAAHNLDLVKDKTRQGLSLRSLAAVCGVSTSTLADWRSEHADFELAIVEGRDQARNEIECALVRRAVGYDHESTESIVTTNANGDIMTAIEKKKSIHVAPETKAIEFYLRNKDPENWQKSGDDVNVNLPGVMVIPESKESWTDDVKAQQDKLRKSSVQAVEDL